MYMPAGQKRAPDFITNGCEPPCGCWELNSGPLKIIYISSTNLFLWILAVHSLLTLSNGPLGNMCMNHLTHIHARTHTWLPLLFKAKENTPKWAGIVKAIG